MTRLVHRLDDGPSSHRWRDTPFAHVVGRIAYLFAAHPDWQRVAVCRTGMGYIKVVDEAQIGRSEVLGVYSRDVTIAQVIEDLR